MTQEELSAQELRRVNKCEYYQMTKNIMESHITYQTIEVGEVFFVKSKLRDNTYRYVSRNGGGKDKFMAFHKCDKGFIFIKRINATGKLGVEVQCLTTQYPAPRYEIESDPDYVDSIIFNEGKGYDPLAAEKLLTKKKGQARRKNKKLEIVFKTDQEAYDHSKTYSVGDVIYDLSTTYGSGLIAWRVTQVNIRPVDQTEQRYGGRVKGNTREDQDHNRAGFKELVSLSLIATNTSKERRYNNTTREITFTSFRNSYNKYYSEKPFSTEDF